MSQDTTEARKNKGTVFVGNYLVKSALQSFGTMRVCRQSHNKDVTIATHGTKTMTSPAV